MRSRLPKECLSPFTLQLERAASLLRALADGPRLHILKVLDKKETCVSDIAKALNDKLSTISQRLRILRAEGLVKKRRAGKQLFYSLADQHVSSLVNNALDHAAELESHHDH